jgi:excisionase family DNA binding protein
MDTTDPLETADAPPPTTAPTIKLLLTPTEAAMVLSISRSLLYQLLMDKRIFSVKVGGARRIPLAAIHEYVEALCQLERAG